MTEQTQTSLEAQIFDLLESEHQMLLSADFEMLKTLAIQKENLVLALSARPKAQNPTLTAEIQSKAKRNARLYEAAILGINLATTRLSELRTTLGELKTYDGQGLVTTAATDGPSVSVKA